MQSVVPERMRDAAAGMVMRSARLRAAVLTAWLVALGGVGAMLAWLALAPLEQGVVAPGVVIVEGRRQAVQHEAGGTVAALFVHEGESVTQGQPLLTLDATVIRANLDQAKGRLFLALASSARLRAERAERPPGRLDIDFGADAADPRALAARELHETLWMTTRRRLADDLAVLRAAAEAQAARRRELEQGLQSRRQQLALLEEEISRQAGLAAQGYYPHNRVLERRRAASELAGQIAADEASTARLRAEEREISSRIAQRQSAHREELDATLVDVERELGELREEVRALEFSLARITVRAPASGTVLGLVVHTVGGVIAPGQVLMEIVPDEAPLRIEARIPPNAVSRTHAGLPVELRIAALNRPNTPLVPGVVTQVGADVIVDSATHESYYRTEVRPTADGLRMLDILAVQPGMPLEVFVRTGRRSALSYLVKPLLDRFDDALTEG